MRAPIRSLALTATVIAALAAAGCKSGESAAPTADPAASSPAAPATSASASPSSAPSSASHAPSPSRTKRALAGPGTGCGPIFLPNSTAMHRVVVTKGHMSCAVAMSTIKRYYIGVSKGRGGGNTATLEVGHFVCQSPTAVTSQQLKAATVCENPASNAAFKVTL
ncbi:MAG TPA: hypothetical protein VGL93_17790 [Streptosporangiaceae bacterium]|jgi:hypothetical protein